MVFDEKLFDFNELVNEVGDHMQQTTQSHTINLNVEASDMVLGDRSRPGNDEYAL